MSSIQHTVAFRLVHPAGSAAEAGLLETARRTLTAVPGITRFTVHRQVSPKSDLAWQLPMVFADAAAFAAYDAHPAHQELVRTRWVPAVDAFAEPDLVAVDPPTA